MSQQPTPRAPPKISHPVKATSIKLPDLEAALNPVASARSKVHVRKMGLLVRWENDDTDAERDLATMEAILRPLGVQCNEFVIPNTDETPEWNIYGKVHELMRPCVMSSLPALFVFYYAGHASLAFNNELFFTSHKRRIRWRFLISTLQEGGTVDSLVILDCCHAGAVSRRPDSDTNVHLMAACGPDEIASERSHRISFTSRLFRAMQKFRELESFTTADWYSRVHSESPASAPYPVFETLSGTGTISLVWSDTSQSRIPRPISGASQKRVLVKLTLEGQLDVVDSFSNAIRKLPRDMEVEIRDAFETDASFLFLLRMSWEAWVLWSSVVPLEFVGVTLGPALS